VARYLLKRTTPPRLMSLRDGGLLLVEDGQRGLDDLVGRDELRRHHPRIQLPRVADEELEGGGTIQDTLEVVFRVAERREVHDVLHCIADELAGDLGGGVERRIVRGVDVREEFLRHDLEELYGDAGVTQVVEDEHLDPVGVGLDDFASAESHYLVLFLLKYL